MSLQGLPDFQAPLQGPNGLLYYPFEAGSFTALPSALTVAEAAGGGPDLHLAITRPSRLGQPPSPSGTLDLRLQLQYALDAALAIARRHQPAATVAPVPVASGFVRLWPASGLDLPDPLAEPIPVLWDGLDSGRFTLHLPIDAAELFAGMLADSTVGLRAHAELELAGVAPRLPIQLTFDPSALVEEIQARTGGQAQVSRAALLSLFRQPPASASQVVGSWGGDQADLAAVALVDWLRARLGQLAPAPAPAPDTFLLLPTPAQAGTGTMTWDLSQPVQSWRPVALDFDPLLAVRQQASGAALDALVSRDEVPAMPTGQLMVKVTANLPRRRPGLLELGVTLEAPPRPPFRMQTARATALLQPPADSASLVLRLSPGEQPDYTSSTFAVPAGGSSGAPLAGPVVEWSGSLVRLTMDDFPVEFHPVKASAALLELCTVGVTFQPGADSLLPAVTGELDRGQGSLAFSQPVSASGSTLTAEARPRDGSASISLGPVPAAPWSLDLASFATYGPQQVPVTVTFADGPASYAVELLPEAAAETPEALTVFDFTSKQPQRTWTYVSLSPFHGGYRWREFRSQPPLADWSPVLQPGAPLSLEVGTPVPTEPGITP